MSGVIKEVPLPPPTADAALVDGLRHGEREAFRELYDRFAQSTFGFLLRLCGRRDVAEDLHQEAWLSIARHAARLTPETDLAAWVFTVARNRFRSSRRRAQPAAVAEFAAADRLGTAPTYDPGCRDLERALVSLSEPYREILLLVGIEGLDTTRAAVVLDIKPDAARQRLARARAALAEALAASEPPQLGGRRASS